MGGQQREPVALYFPDDTPLLALDDRLPDPAPVRLPDRLRGVHHPVPPHTRGQTQGDIGIHSSPAT